jgi:ABC-2 type transport system permease protein
MKNTTQNKKILHSVNWIGLYTLLRRELARTMRVATQTLVTPWISALLYIFVFGSIIGRRIDLIAGVPYITFVLPGILTMNVISSAFGSSSSALYFQRFLHTIEEMLVAPFSHLEMLIGFVLGGVARAIVIAAGIFVLAIFFGGAHIEHILLFLITVFLVSTIFSIIGVLVGLWANNFEQLTVLTTFVIMPLSFLGGTFYSINMLPERFRILAYLNPFFYFIDSTRCAMISVCESNQWIGFGMMLSLVLVLGWFVWFLFERGWRLRV